jgi:hypothetical protein
MRFKLTRSGRRHRIGVAHVAAALGDAGPPLLDTGTRRAWVGVDDRGIELEIIAINDGRDDVWAIIHVMPTSFENIEIGKDQRDDAD